MICLRLGKTTEAKLHRVNLRSPRPKIHYYQNKWLEVKESQYLIMKWKSLLSMHGSKYVTNQPMHGFRYVTNTPTWERCWLQSYSIHPHDEDQETPWLQNPWCINATAFSRKRWIGVDCLRSQYACNNKCNHLMTALKIILIYV